MGEIETAASGAQLNKDLALGLAYAAVFAGLGVLIPFWPLWLGGRGLSPAQISVVLTAAIWCRALAGPAWGQFADRRGVHRRLLIGLALGAACCTALLHARLGFAWILVLGVVFNGLYGPTLPLLDGITILEGHARNERGRRLDYGRLRLWGSLAFIVVTISVGRFLDGRDKDWVLAPLGGLMLIAALASLAVRQPAATRERALRPMRELLVRRRLLIFLGGVALIQGSHACYYAFATNYWADTAGISRSTIGLLWAEGVIAEVLLFAVAARRIHCRPTTMLLIGAVGAAVRWVITAHTTSVPMLAAVQWLHAASFGCTHLAAIRYVAKHVPRQQTATAQTLFSAAAGGIGPGIALPIAGQMFAASPRAAFLLMAGLSTAGAILACTLLRHTPSETADRP